MKIFVITGWWVYSHELAKFIVCQRDMTVVTFRVLEETMVDTMAIFRISIVFENSHIEYMDDFMNCLTGYPCILHLFYSSSYSSKERYSWS